MFHYEPYIITYIIHFAHKTHTSNDTQIQPCIYFQSLFFIKITAQSIHHNFPNSYQRYTADRARTRPSINYPGLRPGCNVRVMELRTWCTYYTHTHPGSPLTSKFDDLIKSLTPENPGWYIRAYGARSCLLEKMRWF